MYLVMLFFSFKLIEFTAASKSSKSNYKLFIAILILSLFASELILKYVVKMNLSYLERNGGFYYNSMYKRRPWDNFKLKYFQKEEDIQVATHPHGLSGINTTSEYSYKHTYNSLGLRDVEPKANDSLYTIIGLGDSFTEGVGSSQDSTWLKLFEMNLIRSGMGSNSQCINAGIGASDPVSELLLFKRKLTKFRPKMVIVCINNTDVTDIIVRGGKERFHDGTVSYAKGPWWEFFYSFSYIFRAIAHSFFKIDYLFLTEKQYCVEERKAQKIIEDCISNDFKTLAKNGHFKLIVVLSPMQYELEQKRFLIQPLSDYFTMDSTLQTIDLYKEYTLAHNERGINYKDLYWKIDLHHNSKGYQLWADILSEKLTPILKRK